MTLKQTVLAFSIATTTQYFWLQLHGCFVRKELTRVNGYFEVAIPAYLSGEFENHFRMTKESCQLLTQEIMYTGRIPTGISSGRPAIFPEKRILLFLQSVWYAAPPAIIAFSSVHVSSRSVGRPNPTSLANGAFNKLTSVFHASVLLLIMNFVITLSK